MLQTNSAALFLQNVKISFLFLENTNLFHFSALAIQSWIDLFHLFPIRIRWMCVKKLKSRHVLSLIGALISKLEPKNNCRTIPRSGIGPKQELYTTEVAILITVISNLNTLLDSGQCLDCTWDIATCLSVDRSPEALLQYSH